MYAYKTLFGLGVLILKFSGNYFEDEAQEGLLNVAKLITLDEKYAITTVILDLKDVTSMTMDNTDSSRVAYWQRELISVMTHPKKDAIAHLAALKIFHVLPENNVVKDIFFNRRTKLSRDDRITRVGSNNFNNLVNVLEHLGLLALMPLLAEGWKEGPIH